MTENTIHFHVANDPMFAENSYTVYLRDGGPCWIVDPGLPPQADDITAFIKEHELQPQAIVLTHAHADHIAGIDEVLAGVGDLPVYLAREEWPMLTDGNENLSAAIGPPITVSASDVHDLPAGSTLELDGTVWEIGDVSGHSPGGRSLYCAGHKVVLVGDALFAGSVGRVDFHHSDGKKLLTNIREALMSLPDDTTVLSGHGPATTIGAERTSNPFIIHGF
jgi:hydroxyacylglutathione hydrolase